MKLTCRLHTKEDEPELIRLWSEHSGWDQPDAETWKNRLMSSPFGETPIVIAIDAETNHIIGQIVFIPLVLDAGDRRIKALRPFAPIITHSSRTTLSRKAPKKTLPLKMYLQAVRELRQRGYGLIYAMPDPRWRRFLSIIPDFQSTTFPLWSLRLPLKSRFPLEAGFSTTEIELSDPRIDELWDSSRQLHMCSAVRDKRFWSWKPNLYGYRILSIEKDGRLMGLVGSLNKGDHQWLICDMLFADSEASLKATLSAVCNLAQEQAIAADPQKPIDKVAILVTPVMEKVIKDLGFFRDTYDFSLFIHRLDRTIPKVDIDPSKWYVCATD